MSMVGTWLFKTTPNLKEEGFLNQPVVTFKEGTVRCANGVVYGFYPIYTEMKYNMTNTAIYTTVYTDNSGWEYGYQAIQILDEDFIEYNYWDDVVGIDFTTWFSDNMIKVPDTIKAGLYRFNEKLAYAGSDLDGGEVKFEYSVVHSKSVDFNRLFQCSTMVVESWEGESVGLYFYPFSSLQVYNGEWSALVTAFVGDVRTIFVMTDQIITTEYDGVEGELDGEAETKIAFMEWFTANTKLVKTKLTRLYPTHIIGKDGGKAFRKLSPATEELVFVYNGDGTCSIAQSSTVSEWPTDSDLVIPSRSPDGDAVTEIYESAFSGNYGIVNVFIPESVILIGEDAFYDCMNVIKIVVPKSVTTISDYAFYSCESLVDIDIPDSVTTLGTRAFSSCESLTSIVIPDSVISLGTHIFSNCSALTNVTLPSNMTRLPNAMFNLCTSLKNIELPAGLLSMGTSVFSSCRALSSIVIPDGITSIETGSFHSCTSLISVDIPDGLTNIGNQAFKRCSSLVSIDIPDGVTNIGENAFGYCTSLENIIIPDSVTTLGDSMFDECTSLKSAIIGNNVTSPIGEYMFYDCVALTDITIGTSVTGIGYEAFANCTSLATITIPSSVTTIEEIAFNGCTSLSTIKFNGTRAQWNAITLGENWNYGVPATFVTCYDGVVYIENPAITFTVNGTSYKATTGQTWREWASSSDNTAGFSIKSLTISGVSSEYVVVSSSGNSYTVIDGKSDFIRPDETITSGTAYLTTTVVGA